MTVDSSFSSSDPSDSLPSYLAERLPDHLAERARLMSSHSRNPDGRFVLYWMRTAVRADENPALDAAITLANAEGLPLLVYHGLSQSNRLRDCNGGTWSDYASDRHHTFILQGARDVQQALKKRGIAYAFHLERPGHAGDYLRQLAEQAAVVVTEDMPTDPPRHFTRQLVKGGKVALLAVDTACVLPMRLVGRSYDRAFAFRNKTEKQYAQRVSQPWPQLDLVPQQYDLTRLPFEPVDLASANFADLVAECEIDHSIAPAVDTVGGSIAGYARWNAFLEDGLRSYAKRRNNALADGVSRMSPYLHYGMVSPLRIAREASQQKGNGAKKFLDELLIWRELAYAYCHYETEHDQWTTLPDWAQQTLLKHQANARSQIYTWEQLVRGETSEPLWNAAQRSLLQQGELHNNVRMTWGKAILNWSASPIEALQRIIDLNHRYALDGRDPASYGGILWCLGLFDRPFQPEQPILGSIRPRPLSHHANRLDVEAYRAHCTTPRFSPVPSVAVIGAGISGTFAARTLQDHGLSVTLFEKSRGIGGRMATRRTDSASFDHGAQYFTARDPRFQRYLKSWLEMGIVARWDGEIAVYEHGRQKENSADQDRYVGVPAMNVIAKHLAADLRVERETLVDVVRAKHDRFELVDADGNTLGEFDRVIVSTPAPQAAHILRELPDVASQLEGIDLEPCLAAMLELPTLLPVKWSGAFINSGPIRWVARNQTKPRRDGNDTGVAEAIVIHAGAEWSRQHLELDKPDIAANLLAEFWPAIGLQPAEPIRLYGHRWRYSIPHDPLPQRCVASEDRRIVACGDWAGGPRVEGAFLSGNAAAGRILGTLQPAKSARSRHQQQRLF